MLAMIIKDSLTKTYFILVLLLGYGIAQEKDENEVEVFVVH